MEEFKDQVRWVPTDHMLADSFTKSMPADLLMQYLKTGVYSFKYDDEIKNTKWVVAKERKDAREAKAKTPKHPPKCPPPVKATPNKHNNKTADWKHSAPVGKPVFPKSSWHRMGA